MPRVAVKLPLTSAQGEHGRSPPRPVRAGSRASARARALVTLAAAGVVLAYALPGGAYDIIVRQEYGLVVWWILAVGLALGVLPRARPSRLMLGAGCALLAYCAWVGLSLAWTESAENTSAELARALGYLGLVALIGSIVDRRIWRAAAEGLALGAMVVCVLAVASRLFPGAFPANIVGRVFATDRLSYPFGYWNAVAAWGAMSTAIGLGWSANDPSRLRRALALSLVPFSATMTYLSYSRAGVAGVVLAVLVVILLSRNRWTAVLHTLVAAFGTAIVITVIRAHAPIAHATGGGGAGAVLAVLLFASALCAIAAVLTRAGKVDRWRLPRRMAHSLAFVVVIALALSAAAFGPHLVSRGWHEFRNPVIAQTANPAQRLTTLSGTRYNLWKVALEAFDSHVLTGTGAGTYEFWWNRHQLDTEFVRNAHSIWLETMAELGLPGLLAIVAVVVSLLAVGIAARRRVRRDVGAAASAALLAAFVVYLLHASVDWMWQETAVTVLALGAIAVASGRAADRPLRLGRAWRLALVVAALAAGASEVPGLLSTLEVRRSQAAERRGDGPEALAWASDAISAEPWAASPYIQRGLVLESAGRYAPAAADLRAAIRRERTNYASWVILARIETERGRLGVAVQDYDRAHQLLTEGTLFGPVAPDPG